MIDIIMDVVIFAFTILPIVLIFGGGFFLSAVKIIYEYERAVIFTFGKYSGMLKPGLNIVIPVVQTIQKVDMRIKTVDIPSQEVMTVDNVPVRLNAVVYFKVQDPKRAILDIQDYSYAVAQYAHTALRDIIGGESLDALLSKREIIANEIKKLVDKETDSWGIDVSAIKIQDVELPSDMKRTMAKQAEAERERRAVIIKAEGEVIAAKNLSKAAHLLGEAPGALHLRTLNTLNDLSSDQSNTVVFAVPMEIINAIQGFANQMHKKK